MKRRIYIIIAFLAGCVAVAAYVWYEVRTTRRMRAAVEVALEMNRNYEAFTSDTVLLDGDSSIINHHFSFINPRRISLRSVVAYYDHPLRFWVSSNERLRAHYALGCAYRDLHEAPMALLSWEDAIACADTTSASCDFSTLFRVYGQMADIYYRQYMPEKLLAAQLKSSQYALAAGDTANYIRGRLLLNSAYELLNDSAAIFKNTEVVRKIYLERGMYKEAVQTYASPIIIAVESGAYDKAASMMQIFEKESGLFDNDGNIAPSRENYYYQKGFYFLGVHQLDSAEYQFRRLLRVPEVRLNGYHGLMSLYKVRGNVDSTFKYMTIYQESLAAYLKTVRTDAVTQAESMYDYSIQEKEAKEQERRARLRGYIIFMILGISIIGLIYFRRKKIIREKAFHQTMQAYLQTKTELGNAMNEIAFLKKSLPKQEESQRLLDEKEKQILKMQSLIQNYRATIGLTIPDNDEEALMNSAIVQKLRTICHIQTVKENGIIRTTNPRACTTSEWQELFYAIKKLHFSLYYLITVEKHLPKLQYKVSVLSRLHFSTNEMAFLIGTTGQNVSNARSRAVKRLFDSNDTTLLDSRLPSL